MTSIHFNIYQVKEGKLQIEKEEEEMGEVVDEEEKQEKEICRWASVKCLHMSNSKRLGEAWLLQGKGGGGGSGGGGVDLSCLHCLIIKHR